MIYEKHCELLCNLLFIKIYQDSYATSVIIMIVIFDEKEIFSIYLFVHYRCDTIVHIIR